MNPRRALHRLVVPVALGSMLAISSAAAAQPVTQDAAQPTILRPPTSGGTTDEPPRFRMYLTVIVIGALILGANAIPSKRGHQD